VLHSGLFGSRQRVYEARALKLEGRHHGGGLCFFMTCAEPFTTLISSSKQNKAQAEQLAAPYRDR